MIGPKECSVCYLDHTPIGRPRLRRLLASRNYTCLVKNPIDGGHTTGEKPIHDLLRAAGFSRKRPKNAAELRDSAAGSCGAVAVGSSANSSLGLSCLPPPLLRRQLSPGVE